MLILLMQRTQRKALFTNPREQFHLLLLILESVVYKNIDIDIDCLIIFKMNCLQINVIFYGILGVPRNMGYHWKATPYLMS